MPREDRPPPTGLLVEALVVAAAMAATVLLALAPAHWFASGHPITVPAAASETVPDTGAEGLAALDPEAVRRRARALVQPRLEELDRQLERDVDVALAPARAFFEARKPGARAFADAALSLESKWLYARGRLGGTAGRAAHLEYLARAWAEHLFRPDELQVALAGAASDYLAHIRGAEDRLLVRIRADLADLPPAVLPQLRSDQALKATYAAALDAAAREVGPALKADLGRELGVAVGTAVAVPLLAAIGGRLGHSAGLLGTGAAAGLETFGVALGAALALDWAIGRLTDPAPALAAHVAAQLDRLAGLAIEGDGRTRGLRAELLELHRTRAAWRRRALDRLLSAPTGGAGAAPP